MAKTKAVPMPEEKPCGHTASSPDSSGSNGAAHAAAETAGSSEPTAPDSLKTDSASPESSATSDATSSPTAPDAGPPGSSKEPANAESLLAKIQAKNREVSDAERKVDAAKKELKAKKGIWEKLVSDLQSLIRTSSEDLPLYAKSEETDSVPTEASSPEHKWRDVPIPEAFMGISERMVELLAGSNITTMGEYSDFCKAKGDFSDPLTLIKEIGPTAAEKIRSYETAFWVRWDMQQKTNASATTSEADLSEGGAE